MYIEAALEHDNGIAGDAMVADVFEQRSVLPVSASTAFACHERTGAIDRLIPPWESVEVVKRGAGLRAVRRGWLPRVRQFEWQSAKWRTRCCYPARGYARIACLAAATNFDICSSRPHFDICWGGHNW